jgi:hypothetical protein
MADSPKDNETKLNRILNAWKTLASDKTFAGMTVVQFETDISPSFTTRQQLEDLDDQRTHLLNTRANADTTSLAKGGPGRCRRPGRSSFGPDSSLIEAMGYVRKSERKSGLTRKGSNAPSTGGTPPPAS